MQQIVREEFKAWKGLEQNQQNAARDTVQNACLRLADVGRTFDG